MYAKEYFHPFNPTPLQYKPLILVGPSGVGKYTLVHEAIKKYGNLFECKKSVTTRKTREIEKNASNFIFVSPAEFKKMKENDEFIECQQKLIGNMYGTSKAELGRIKGCGKIPVIEVDV